MKKNLNKNLILLLLLAYFVPAISLAASISVLSEKNTFAQNEDFLVQVSVDTEGVSANAVEGTISYPSDILELKEIRDGNSSVNFWVERPHITTEGKISFSGITPGGFYGSEIFLLSLVFHAKAQGEGLIAFDYLKLLKNDGQGSGITTEIRPLAFSVEGILEGKGPNLAVVDIDPPEDFTPFIASDPTIFDGKYFLVFSTIDKGTGISHYEVREGIWGAYTVAESPYLLKDQTLSNEIYVKAIDKSGNKRIEQVHARNPLTWLDTVISLGIIILVLLCILILRKIWPRLFRR